MTAKKALLTGCINQHGFSLDYAKLRQETLHRCRVCERLYSRNDMRIVNGVFICVTCAGDAQDESQDE